MLEAHLKCNVAEYSTPNNFGKRLIMIHTNRDGSYGKDVLPGTIATFVPKREAIFVNQRSQYKCCWK